MHVLNKVVKTFPSAQLPSLSGGLPVEVALIAQLGHGSGDQLFESVSTRQRAHESFVDELEEPSARLGGVDLSRGDPTSLYSFVVGPRGHPFHRHAGHRVFTAVSGSGGAQLRFSSASSAHIERDPQSFVDALRFVNIPPDCLFTVRFGGETWHQFMPLLPRSRHPAFFALSCHTNELGGALPEALRSQVLANAATIPALTELLPPKAIALLEGALFNPAEVPTIALALDAPTGSLQGALCKTVRSTAGVLRGLMQRWRDAGGFHTASDRLHRVIALNAPPAGSLLLQQFAAQAVHHEDCFGLSIDARESAHKTASALLAALLEGFLQNRPIGVTRLMSLRNVLVRPLGLRRSPLGCPVSSLLSGSQTCIFAQRYPVIAQLNNAGDTRAEVILGADDKHLKFRSCVSVEITGGRINFHLGTRVQCTNGFGRFYMAAIDRVHRRYVAPTMLMLAVDHVIQGALASDAMQETSLQADAMV
ncbi:MAG: DUF2867 domain-containing protein [Tahibacter sp.]